MKYADPKIDTVPLPEIEFHIPRQLLTEFEEEPRVIRRPEIWGIPVPEELLTRKLVEIAGDQFEVFLVPKHG